MLRMNQITSYIHVPIDYHQSNRKSVIEKDFLIQSSKILMLAHYHILRCHDLQKGKNYSIDIY